MEREGLRDGERTQRDLMRNRGPRPKRRTLRGQVSDALHAVAMKKEDGERLVKSAKPQPADSLAGSQSTTTTSCHDATTDAQPDSSLEDCRPLTATSWSALGGIGASSLSVAARPRDEASSDLDRAVPARLVLLADRPCARGRGPSRAPCFVAVEGLALTPHPPARRPSP